MTGAPLATPTARRARARVLELVRSGPADPQLLHELVRQLRLIVPFTASFWSASDPFTLLATSPARIENLDGQCERWWEREFLIQDFNLFRDLARAERPVATLWRATDGLLQRSVRHRELHRDLGYGDELRAVFRSGGATWGFASLWRKDGEPSFSLAEEKAVADLAAPIAEAFRRAALLRASSAGASIEAPGLLVFDQRGLLESFNDDAERWLEQLPPTVGGTPGPSGVALPAEVRTVVALAHAIAAGVERGVARARLQSRSGRWLVVHGFPLRGPRQGESRTAVVIEPAKASEIAPIIVEAYDLTAREKQITEMIARGLASTAIAEQLCLSPHTVRDYVKDVFRKVGVSSRGELVARIFAEHYVDALHDSVARGDGTGCISPPMAELTPGGDA